MNLVGDIDSTLIKEIITRGDILEKSIDRYDYFIELITCSSTILILLFALFILMKFIQYVSCYCRIKKFRNEIKRNLNIDSVDNSKISIYYQSLKTELEKEIIFYRIFYRRFSGIYNDLKREITIILENNIDSIGIGDVFLLNDTIRIINSYLDYSNFKKNRIESLTLFFAIITVLLMIYNNILIHQNNKITVKNSQISFLNSRVSNDNSKANMNNTNATIDGTKATRINTDASCENTAANYRNTEATLKGTLATYDNTDASCYNTEASKENTDASKDNTRASNVNTDASKENTKASASNTENIRENSIRVLKNTNPGYTYLDEFLKDTVIRNIQILIHSLYVLENLDKQASPFKDSILSYLTVIYPNLDIDQKWRVYIKYNKYKLNGYIIEKSGFASDFSFEWENNELNDTILPMSYFINNLRQKNKEPNLDYNTFKSKNIPIEINKIKFVSNSIDFKTFNSFKFKIIKLSKNGE